MRHVSRVGRAAAAAIALATVGLAGQPPQEDALTERARGIHERVMTLDTHADINASNFSTADRYARS